MGTFNRNQAAELAARTQESYQSRDGDRMFTGMFRDDLESKPPVWKVKEGNHWFDIIPYTAGEQDPGHSPGEGCYVLDVYVHTNVGPREQSFVCPEFNYKQPCPICEHRQTLRDQAPDGGPEKEAHDELVKSLMPKRRVLYNVVVQDSQETQNQGVQILDAAHWNMERHLILLANRTRGQGDGSIVFADADEGKRIVFTRTGTGAKNTQYTGHAFEDRKYTIPDEWLEQAYTLDELLHIPEYDEIATAFFGGSGTPAAAPAPAAKPTAVPVGGRVAPAPAGARPVPLRRPAPATVEEPEDPESTEAQEPEDDQPAPPPRRAKAPLPTPAAKAAPPRTLTRVAPAPAPKAAAQPTGEQECPEPTGTFGVDTDQFDKCQTCEVWEACAQAKTRAMAAERAKKGPARPAPRR